MQIHPGRNLEGILTEVSAGPGGSQQHFQQAQPLATVSNGANIRAGTANLLPDIQLDSHPFRVLRPQLLAVRPKPPLCQPHPQPEPVRRRCDQSIDFRSLFLTHLLFCVADMGSFRQFRQFRRHRLFLRPIDSRTGSAPHADLNEEKSNPRPIAGTGLCRQQGAY